MKKGFTLIELLVVIAIIAILAAILFPVCAQAREKARAAPCLSNCKQLGTALMLYVDDYDETVPPMENTAIGITAMQADSTWKTYPSANFHFTDWAVGGGDCWSWSDAIFPYVKNIQMYVCPSGGKNKYGYGYNSMLVGGYTHFDANPSSAFSNQTGPACVCLAQLSNSSEIVAFCDTIQYTSNLFASTTMSPVLAYQTAVTGSSFLQPNRHNGGMNITYCDGHAKFCKLHQGPSSVGEWSWGDGCQYWDPAYYNN